MLKDPISQMGTLSLEEPTALLMRLSKAVLSYLEATLLEGCTAQSTLPHCPLSPSHPMPSSSQAVTMLSWKDPGGKVLILCGL